MDRKNHEEPHVIITFNGEKHTLEEWARQETAADQEKSLDWNDAFPKTDRSSRLQPPSKKDRHLSTKRKRRRFRRHPKNGKPLLRDSVLAIKYLALPAAAALIVGLIIGLSVLMVFAGQEKDNEKTGAMPAAPQNNSASDSSMVTRDDLRIPMYVIQAGVFSTKEAANLAADHLKAEGLSAITVEAGRTAVYISAAETEEQARQLADVYKDRGVSVYPKTWSLEPSEKPVALTDGSLAASIDEGGALLQQLLKLSGESADTLAPSEETLKKTEQMLAEWRTHAIKNLDPERQQQLDQFRKETADSVKKARTLFEKKDSPSFHHYQESLLRVIVAYRQWI